MSRSGRHFLSSESGSLAPILAIMLIPICAALGISVDYNAAIATRASMQNALDAATLSITTLQIRRRAEVGATAFSLVGEGKSEPSDHEAVMAVTKHRVAAKCGHDRRFMPVAAEDRR